MPTIPAAISYNKNMGGVDLNDQHRKYYVVGRKSRKWWRYILWFLVGVSIVNGHILESEALNHCSKTQLDFRLELAKILISNFSSHPLSFNEGRNTGGHWPKSASKGCWQEMLKA